MKYLFFTFEGNGLPIALHLQQEGHKVLVGQVIDKKLTLTRAEKRISGHEGIVEQKRRLALYKNIVDECPADELIERMKKIKNKDDYFVFFDSNNLFYYSSLVLKMGFTNGNFPTEHDRLFEVDRDAAKDFVHKYYPAIKITKKEEFRSIAQGKKFLKENNHGQMWVLKGKVLEAPTIVPNTSDPELAKWQIIESLDAFQDAYESAGFILERCITDVVEITPEKIYYDGVPLGVTLNFENKPVGSGNLSIQTGCAADLVFPIDMNCKINKIAFPPIVDELAKKHKGLFFWDASLLIDRKTGDVYFGEFCPNRPGYNSFFTTLSQMSSVNYFFESVMKKKNPYKLGTVGASTTLFNLYRDPSERYILSGASVEYKENSAKDTWVYDIEKVKKNDKMRIVGYDWQLAPITGSGNTIGKAVANVFKNVNNFSLQGVYYRPKYDYLSLEYSTSILNRLQYGLKRGLYTLPFEFKL